MSAAEPRGVVAPTAPEPTATGTHQVLGACPHDCPDTCALLTTVQDGVALKVQGNPAHAHTDGVLCTKVSRYTERTYHPERIVQPLRRSGPKGSGQFQPITWDQALDEIAQRLGAIAAVNPEAILPYSYAGTMGLVQGEGMAARFFHALGASLLDRTICATAGGEAFTHTLGGKVGMHVEHFAKSRLILIWGSNSIGSNLHFWRLVQQAKRDGARLICIDPRRTETAEKCHQHIALLPGTDAALALGLMHELIANDWLDHDYLERHTLGWEGLRERALQWPPQRVAAVCGITEQEVRDLARDYGETAQRGEPVAIRANYGLQRVRGGGNAMRAIACLPALVGAWRHAAGGVLLSSSGWFPVQRPALYRPDLLGPRRPRTLNMSTIGADLLRPASPDFGPQVQALVVYNSNPVAVAPQSGQVVQGFQREDLFTVVLEHFQTDTADHADIILPATTQLEHWDVHLSYGHTDVLLNRPAIAPVGQARSNTEVFRALAERMRPIDARFADPCFADDDLTLCRTAFGDTVDFEALLARGFTRLNLPDAPFAQGGFPTPSGKCEFYSAHIAELGRANPGLPGLDGWPAHVPNYEGSPARQGADTSTAPHGADTSPAPHGAEAPPSRQRLYPLAMISPPARNFLNSSFVNVKSLRDIEGEPVLEISAQDAQVRGLVDGSVARVFNERGEYHCRLRISARARPGVVHGLGIWWRKLGLNGTNVNELTSQHLTDLGRGPVFYDCAVEVQPVAANAALTTPVGAA